jgi:membrane protein
MWDIIKRTASCWSEDKAMRLAAALACYTILSLAPLVVITMKIAAVTFHATDQAQRQLEQLVGQAGAKAITDMAQHSKQTGSGTLAAIVSFVVLVISASSVFAELQDSMNTIWEVRPRPDMGWWDTIKKRFFSMGMVFGIIFLLLVSMFVTAALGGVVDTVVKKAGSDQTLGLLATAFSYIVDFVVTVLIVGVLFTLIFKFLPDVKIRFRDVWLGGLLTGVLFKIGQYVLAAYFNFGSTTSAYGAAGSLVAVLLWAYYSSCILFFGAEFTQVYAKRFGAGIRPDLDAIPITAEERAQQGIPKKEDVDAATEAVDHVTGRNRAPSWAGTRAGKAPHVVTITRPTIDSRRAYAVAGLGLASGFIVGAIGLLTGRKYTAHGLGQVHLKKRLDEIEDRYGRGKKLQRFALETRLHDRLEDMEHHLHEATSALRDGAHEKPPYHRPRWLKRLDKFVSS